MEKVNFNHQPPKQWLCVNAPSKGVLVIMFKPAVVETAEYFHEPINLPDCAGWRCLLAALATYFLPGPTCEAVL